MEDFSKQLTEVLFKMGIITDDLSLYKTACVHRSYLNENKVPEHNERLEFLGDAALELAMTHLIFAKYPDKDEGWMTDLRSSFVRGTHLAAIALDFGLDEVVQMSQGERNAGGTKNPNILADMFEAILWAYYLDQGFDAVTQVVKNVIFTSERVVMEVKDPKSRLQEMVQQYLNITPEYSVISEVGKDHEKVFTISASIAWVTIGTGSGTNKKLAQEAAALDAFSQEEKWRNILVKENSI